MRLLLLIISFYFSCLSFGQDSSQVDTTLKTLSFPLQETITADSFHSTVNDIVRKKKPHQKRKLQKSIIKDEPVSIKEENTKQNDETENSNALIVIGLLLIVIIIIALSRSTFSIQNRQISNSSKDEDYISDHLSRILLPRREYYRNVYLKSEAWKRKRYVVLKRDNWTCVYCGGRATEVHHTRYAKRNIGKEPIEWLVSICRTCHASKH